MQNKPTILSGNVYTDVRGSLQYVNDERPGKYRRFYIITHPEINIVRAWQGHKNEEKSFYVLNGCFMIAVVQPLDFEDPSSVEKPEYFTMKKDDSLFLKVPGSCYTGIKACAPGSVLLVLSSATLEESKIDDFRLPPDTWPDWPKIEQTSNNY